MALLTVVGAVTGGGDEQLGLNKELGKCCPSFRLWRVPWQTKFVLRSSAGIPKAVWPQCALADSCVVLPAGCLRTEAYVFLDDST